MREDEGIDKRGSGCARISMLLNEVVKEDLDGSLVEFVRVRKDVRRVDDLHLRHDLGGKLAPLPALDARRSIERRRRGRRGRVR